MKNEFIKWNDMYSVHDENIDNDHKKFISIINRLFEAFSEGNANTIVNSTIKELQEYSTDHFNTEEEYLKNNNYPEVQAHIDSHKKFILKIDEFNKLVSTESENIHYEILTYLKSWFNEHILGDDIEFSKKIKSEK